MASLLDRCSFIPTAGGTTDFVVSVAATGYMDPATAGAVNGDIYSYYAQSSDLTQWEFGRGTWDSSTSTFARTTIIKSSNSGSKVNFTSAPTVTVDLLVEDLLNNFVGGRLTLTSGTPVLQSDVTAATTIYYTTHRHGLISLYDGAKFVTWPFTEQSVALDTTNVTSGNLYDLFMFLNAGVPTLGYGPAWTTPGSGSAARSAAIARMLGIWTNHASITLRQNSTTTFTVGANLARYVGTFYAAANGQTAMQFKPAAASGGNSPVLGLFNADNRLLITSIERDNNTGGWTYASTTWRPYDGASSNIKNRITYVDGLAEVYVSAKSQTYCTGSAFIGSHGSVQNSITATPAVGSFFQNSGVTSVPDTFGPVLGLNYIQMMEVSMSGTSNFFSASVSGPTQISDLSIDVCI